MTLFRERLLEQTQAKNNHICLGVDLHLKNLPAFFRKFLEKDGLEKAVKLWISSLIEAASSKVPSIKFQSSFFEALGSPGYALLKYGLELAKSKELITILDAKRCDISSTMAAYGSWAFDELKADSLTIISYMGLDVTKALEPWLQKGHGVYSVYLSSNPSGFSTQSHETLPSKENLAELFHKDIFSYLKKEKLESSFGLVIGVKAFEERSNSLLGLSNKYSFLMPGMGFQGGTMASQFGLLKKQENPFLLPMSRSLSGIGDPSCFEELEALQSFDSYQDFVHARIQNYTRELKEL